MPGTDRDAVAPETVDKIAAALASRVNPAANALNNPPSHTAPAPVATPPAEAPAETPEAKETRERDESGRFKPKELTPEARGLLAAVKAEREKRKALEARIAEYETRAQPKVDKPTGKNPDDFLPKMPEETQTWAKESGKDWVDALVEKRLAEKLGELEPVIQSFRANQAQEATIRALQSDLDEFVLDKALEGIEVDPTALMDTIAKFEKQYDVVLGSTNRKKFENALGLLGASRPAAADPALAASAAAEKAKKEAQEKARAGGVAPGAQASVPPVDQRKELQTSVRERAMKGDIHGIVDLIHTRVPKHPAL